jgi:hypothetical protein
MTDGRVAWTDEGADQSVRDCTHEEAVARGADDQWPHTADTRTHARRRGAMRCDAKRLEEVEKQQGQRRAQDEQL